MMTTFISGLLLGFAFCAPIGPQNIFVISSAMARRPASAMLVGLLVSLVDMSLGLSCFFGMGKILSQHDLAINALLFCGSLFLLWSAIKLFRSSRSGISLSEPRILSLPRILAAAIILTWFNPQAILDGSIFLGASRGSIGNASIAFFLLGMTLASATWFVGLAWSASVLRERLKTNIFSWVQFGSASILLGFGIHFGFQFIQRIA